MNSLYVAFNYFWDSWGINENNVFIQEPQTIWHIGSAL